MDSFINQKEIIQKLRDMANVYVQRWFNGQGFVLNFNDIHFIITSFMNHALCQKCQDLVCLGGSVVEHLSFLGQGMIPGFQDQVLYWAPSGEPASPSASLSVSHE